MTTKRQNRLWWRVFMMFMLLTVALLISCGAMAAKDDDPATGKAADPRVELFGLEGQRMIFTVELARTVAERMQGLMGRTEMPQDHGMLFIFEQSGVQSFWMKNTPLSLDMIFISEDLRVVGVLENTTPYDTSSYYVNAMSRYVLEVNAGQAKAHGIDSGSQVVFHDIAIRR